MPPEQVEIRAEKGAVMSGFLIKFGQGSINTLNGNTLGPCQGSPGQDGLVEVIRLVDPGSEPGHSDPNQYALNPLRFETLRLASADRLATTEKFRNCAEWTYSDWACAMAGEAGEVCDVIKKYNRGDYGETPLGFKKFQQDLSNEIADTITYLDLLANAAGIDMAKAVINKFNEVSDRTNSKVHLSPCGRGHVVAGENG